MSFTLDRSDVHAVFSPIPFDTTQVTSPGNYSNPQPGDPCHPLGAGAHPPAVAFQARFARNGRGAPSEVVPALQARSGESGKGEGAPLVAVPLDMRNALRDPAKHGGADRQGVGVGEPGAPCPTISAASVPAIGFNAGQDPVSGPAARPVGRDPMASAVMSAMVPRRLTPVECERLFGFPDGHTAIPWKGKPAAKCPDALRYKGLGNSMAVPVMFWIGERIGAVDAIMGEGKR